MFSKFQYKKAIKLLLINVCLSVVMFSYVEPCIKKTKPYYKQKYEMLKSNKAVQKNFECSGDLFFLKIIRDYSYALKEVYHHQDKQKIQTCNFENLVGKEEHGR